MVCKFTSIPRNSYFSLFQSSLTPMESLHGRDFKKSPYRQLRISYATALSLNLDSSNISEKWSILRQN